MTKASHFPSFKLSLSTRGLLGCVTIVSFLQSAAPAAASYTRGPVVSVVSHLPQPFTVSLQTIIGAVLVLVVMLQNMI